MDGLKYINDTFGHAEGDQAIIDATRLLRTAFRESDILARLGGDEFAVLAPDTHPDDADKIIGRLQEQVAAHNNESGRAYRLSLTIGAVRYDPVRTPDIDALLVLADAEMYRKKKQRRA
jgi:diguanylate cyclase (GGDEF)-like protein